MHSQVVTASRWLMAPVVCLAVAVAVALPATSLAAPVGCPVLSATHATSPTELQLLEQKMQRLQIRTARFTVRLVLGTPESTIEFSFTGEDERSPSETKVITKGVVHKHSGSELHEATEKREIGNTHYTYEPASTHGDGGRPWVRERLTHQQIKEEEKEEGVGKPEDIASGPFATELLNSAQSIEAAGQATVDGNTVERFNLTFAPGQYPGKELPFNELLEGEFCQPVVNVSLSIDPSGLPVSATVSATYHNSKRTITTFSSEEISAINFPFAALKPPPAKQTISGTALRKLELKRLSEKLRKLKRQQERKRRKKHH